MLKIRRSQDLLIFNMGIPIPVKNGLYIETGPCCCLQPHLINGIYMMCVCGLSILVADVQASSTISMLESVSSRLLSGVPLHNVRYISSVEYLSHANEICLQNVCFTGAWDNQVPFTPFDRYQHLFYTHISLSQVEKHVATSPSRYCVNDW